MFSQKGKYFGEKESELVTIKKYFELETELRVLNVIILKNNRILIKGESKP